MSLSSSLNRGPIHFTSHFHQANFLSDTLTLRKNSEPTVGNHMLWNFPILHNKLFPTRWPSFKNPELRLPSHPHRYIQPASHKKRKLQEFSYFWQIFGKWFPDGGEGDGIRDWHLAHRLSQQWRSLGPSFRERKWQPTPWGGRQGCTSHHQPKVGRRTMRGKVSFSCVGTWPIAGKCMCPGGVEGLRAKTSQLSPPQTKTWAAPSHFRNLAGEGRLGGVLEVKEWIFPLATRASVVSHADSPRGLTLNSRKWKHFAPPAT